MVYCTWNKLIFAHTWTKMSNLEDNSFPFGMASLEVPKWNSWVRWNLAFSQVRCSEAFKHSTSGDVKITYAEQITTSIKRLARYRFSIWDGKYPPTNITNNVAVNVDVLKQAKLPENINPPSLVSFASWWLMIKLNSLSFFTTKSPFLLTISFPKEKMQGHLKSSKSFSWIYPKRVINFKLAIKMEPAFTPNHSVGGMTI